MFRVKRNEPVQLQVSNICHLNTIFRTRCLSPMYCVNLTETSHTHRSISNVCLNPCSAEYLRLFFAPQLNI